MEKNWIELFQQESQIGNVLKVNEFTEKYGLTLNEQEAQLLVEAKGNTLKEQKRVEFGPSVIPKIIYEFCDSAYIDQDHYVETLIRLLSIFYLYKNEMMDEISDDELLHFMKEQFETICYGDMDYLEGTCLDYFAQAIRAGYDGYRGTDGYGEYSKFDTVKRWDYELYFETLKELCWR